MGADEVVEGAVGRTAQLAIVGFDGSEPSLRALDSAVQLISGSGGRIEVVYVAHTPGAVALSPTAQVEVTSGFQAAEGELEELVRTHLASIAAAPSWAFSRRDGVISEELITAAEKARSDEGGVNVIIVVGASSHRYHHVIGSVPVALVRHAAFPILVTP
jgi:nucleotide-binding universal stress UspA family protein